MAGTITQTINNISILGEHRVSVVTLTCTADASDHTFPVTGGAIINPETLGITGYILESVETNPGAVGPTDDYDITIVDTNDCDVAAGTLLNRDISTSERVSMATAGWPRIIDTWVFTITSNSVNSAVVVATLVFAAKW